MERSIDITRLKFHFFLKEVLFQRSGVSELDVEPSRSRDIAEVIVELETLRRAPSKTCAKPTFTRLHGAVLALFT